MKFSDIIGHESLKRHLASSIREGRVAHAQMFLGNEGCGALPLALAYAAMINCLNPSDDDSCGECNSCKKIAQHIHADLHYTFPTISPHKLGRELMEPWRKALTNNPYMGYKQWLQLIDAENKQGNITVDEVRDIIKRLGLKQVEGKYKIQIIWGAELLGKEGNMLLKILEEPPENTLFVLIGEDSEKILPTILSRTQVVKVPALTAVEISDALIERYQCEAERAGQIGSISSGNWNTALNLFEQSDNDLLDQLKKFLNGCLTNTDRKKFIADLEVIAQSGRESLKLFLEYFLMVIEKSTMCKYSGVEPPLPGKAEKEFISKFSSRIDFNKIQPLINDINKAHYAIERNGNPKLILFNLYLSVRKGL